MPSSRRLEPLLLALPGLTLGAAGLLHPHDLSYDTADTWMSLHVAGLVVFPLVGVAAIRLVTGRRDPVAWLVRVAAYVYATFYTGLDLVSGMAAGWVTRQTGPGELPPSVGQLFELGHPLDRIGAAGLVVLALALTADRLLRGSPRTALVGLLLVPGALLVRSDHIFAPQGALGMALIGVGTGVLAAALARRDGEERVRIPATV